MILKTNIMTTYYIAVTHSFHQKYQDNTYLSPKFKLKEEVLTWMIENAPPDTEFVIEQVYTIE